MTVFITLTSAGTNTGPFDLFSDVDGFSSAFETGVPKASLLAGYLSTLAPNGTTVVRVLSTNPLCPGFIDIPVVPSSCDCLTFIYPKTEGGPIANITYVDCSFVLVEDTMADSTSIQVCGYLPTSDSENVIIINSGACTENVCPDCNCYTVYRSMEGIYSISYYDCIGEEYVEELSLDGGTTYTICALPGSIIAPVGITVTNLGTNCSAIGGHCEPTTTTTTTALPLTSFNLYNVTTGFTVDDVYGGGGFDFYVLDGGSAIPCGPGDEAHGDGTTSLAVTVIISGSDDAAFLRLYKNGVLQQTITVSAAGTYTFAPVIFVPGDIMSIILVTA